MDRADNTIPEWLAEFMAELAARHSLRTPEGCQAAAAEARSTSDSFGFRCRSCAALARGYEMSAQCAADIASGDQGAGLGHHEAETRHFREAVDLARKGEEVGA